MKQEIFRLKTFIAAALCLLAVGSFAWADTIRLKDGSVFKGKVTSYNQRKFTITIYVGSSASQHVIPVEEVESIEFDSDTGAPAAAKSAVPETKPKVEPAPVSAPVVRTVEPPVSTNAPLATVTNTKPEPVSAEPAPPTASAESLAEKTINIAAAADWTSTEIRIQRGQRIRITASGEVDLGTKGRSGPSGIPANDPKRLMPNQPTGGLLAVVGDDNNDFVFIGTEGEFVAKQNGVLFLSVNEEKLDDNRGSFIARVKVLPR
ncbi:MAG: hypothetical protein HOP19_05155 [Acidobacteria bacterium]|nr:hypothetical protein [Acidobacteriota bacterium]